MFLRISDAAWLLLGLAGCSAGEPAAGGEMIDCALAGAASFTRECTVERKQENGAALLIVHHPDGGFRRFKVLDNGSLAAADGAETVAFAHNSAGVGASIDGDRYRFPATMLSHDLAR
jgi:hypothetical protein